MENPSCERYSHTGVRSSPNIIKNILFLENLEIKLQVKFAKQCDKRTKWRLILKTIYFQVHPQVDLMSLGVHHHE